MKYLLIVAAAFGILFSGCQGSSEQSTPAPGKNPAEVSMAEKASISVPLPADMQADVAVSGRVSTLRHIDIVKTGKSIPYTYSAGKITNTPGFDWWVSKHFALKSDLPEAHIRLYLELLEMSYPHYVEAFGAEPPNHEQQRIAVVYGSSRAQTKIAMQDDGFNRGVHETAGGETMFYNRAGYNFPSERLNHQRYIVIHETAHAFHMALGQTSEWHPTWFTEGMADSIAHHVYDAGRGQLQVMNFDRPVMDYVKNGLEQYAEDGRPSIEAINNNPALRRGINFLLIHFMLDNPERALKFKLFRDMLFNLQAGHKDLAGVALQALQDAFGDMSALNREFAAYVGHVQKVLHQVTGPWEQDGNAFWVRVHNTDPGVPRIDVNLQPAEKPVYSLLQYDFPAGTPSDLVGAVARGVAVPSIGFDIEYVAEHLHRGLIGVGLGVKSNAPPAHKAGKQQGKKTAAELADVYNPDGDEVVRILVNEGNTLVVEGSKLGLERQSFALPLFIIRELESQQPFARLGGTVTLGETSLSIVLKVKNDYAHTFTRTIPLSAKLRSQLLSRPMAMFAQGANHRITPYFDDGRNLGPAVVDYQVDAPANLWRNPGEPALQRVFLADRSLGNAAPASLKALYQAMLDAADKTPDVQQQALSRFNAELGPLATEVTKLRGESASAALGALAGINISFEWQQADEKGNRLLVVLLHNPDKLPLSGVLTLGREQEQALATLALEGMPPARAYRLEYRLPKPDTVRGVLNIHAEAGLQWEGRPLSTKRKIRGWPYPGFSLSIVDPATIKNGELSVSAALTGPFSGDSKGKIMFAVEPSAAVQNPLQQQDIVIDPFQVLTFNKRYKLRDGVDITNITIQVTTDMIVSGEELLLKSRSTVP